MIDATNPKDISNRYRLELSCRFTDGTDTHRWVTLLQHKGIASFDSAMIYTSQYVASARNFIAKFGYDWADVAVSVQRPDGTYVEIYKASGQPSPYFINGASTKPIDEAVIMALSTQPAPESRR